MMMQAISCRCLMFISLAGLILAGAGCGQAVPPGPQRYELAGEITYQGKPVPRGSLLFAPDGTKGNSGPGAVADIVDGRYKTKVGQGIVGGPHVVTIAGYDGIAPPESFAPNGSPLFSPYEIHQDFPRGNSTANFDVPADPNAQKKPVQ